MGQPYILLLAMHAYKRLVDKVVIVMLVYYAVIHLTMHLTFRTITLIITPFSLKIGTQVTHALGTFALWFFNTFLPFISSLYRTDRRMQRQVKPVMWPIRTVTTATFILHYRLLFISC